MLRWPIVIAITLLVGLAGSQATAQKAIGTVSRIQGKADVTRDGTARSLELHGPVFLNETITTGETARVEFIFTDNTRLTIGEKARLTLDKYVFDPAAGRGRINFGVVGALRFLSGRVSKLANSEVRVSTAVAVIGIRGTEFWAGPIDNQALGVFLIHGAVRVSNAAGAQVLNRPGQGTNIATPGLAPGPVTFWPAAKVNRALAAVAFQ
jgi:hypothetical protein